MNVGIVTLYDYFNHGNRLQNYALEKVLKDMGHKPQTLAIASKRYLPLCYGLTRIFPVISTTRRLIGLMKFTKRELNSKNITFTSFKNLKKHFEKDGLKGQKLDCVIVGSDQVFNPSFIVDSDKMFLRFAPKERRIAYSASFGVTQIADKYKEDFVKGLNEMQSVSIREKEGAQLVEKLTGKEVPVVVDPTMLLTKSDWEDFVSNVSQKRMLKEKYILTYFLEADKAYKEKAEELGKKYGLRVVNINGLFDKHFSVDSKEFVALIKGAELICTNSFHGHALSIVLQKPFVSFSSKASKNSRIKTLLSITGLENRNWQKLSEENLFEIDYSKVEDVLKAERQKGLDFLRGAFEKVAEVK